MSADVSYKKADVALVRNEEIIKVTSHRTHRLVHGGDFEAGNLRWAFWKDRELQLPRNGKLIVQQKQSTFVGDHELCPRVTDREEKNCEAQSVVNVRLVYLERPRDIYAKRVRSEDESPDREHSMLGNNEETTG